MGREEKNIYSHITYSIYNINKNQRLVIQKEAILKVIEAIKSDIEISNLINSTKQFDAGRTGEGERVRNICIHI